MAAFNRLTEATYEVHESVKVDTLDNEDHTFCGIMFPVKCKELLPVEHIAIRSIAVRGQLGPMTVWVSKLTETAKDDGNSNRNRNTDNSYHPAGSRGHHNEDNSNSSRDRSKSATTVFRLKPKYWTKVYEAVHEASQDEYCPLVLNEPIILKPGEVRAIYVHSTLPGDQGIVYDNASFYLPRRGLQPFGGGAMNYGADVRKPRYSDAMINIYTGRAHVSNTAFGQMPIWGWGNAWRDNREFVGQLEYGAVYTLWNPVCVRKFGPKFSNALFNLKLCQTRWESPISRLPDECIYYILNMCRWDWFHDTAQTMKEKYDKEKQRTAEQERQQAEEAQRQQHQGDSSAATGTSMDKSDKATACNHSCRPSSEELDNSIEDYEDALEEQGYDVDGEDEAWEEEENEEGGDDDNDDEDFMDDDDDDDDDGDDDDDSWERANGYRADHNVFRFVDPELEEGEGNREAVESQMVSRQAWIQRQFNRIHVLRALARGEDDADSDDEQDVEMRLVF